MDKLAVCKVWGNKKEVVHRWTTSFLTMLGSCGRMEASAQCELIRMQN